MKIIQVKVKPQARASSWVAQVDGAWLAQVAAPPVDGEVNEAPIAPIAWHFGLRRAQVRIKSGSRGRLKRIQIDD